VDAAFMVDKRTGYIRLSKFTRTSAEEFEKASQALLGQGMKRLIFDLRDNPGGYFDQALALSNQFLKKGAKIVYMKGLHRKQQNYNADGTGKLKDIQLTILVNESSASSSEIVAGAIQDNDRGVIVGRRSYGKGLVQEPIFFTDGSGVRITVARYYTPSGRCIQKPYDNLEDYEYDLYKRYTDGEMLDKDSIKVNKKEAFKTVGGRMVYGGGGIIPDIFVPYWGLHPQTLRPSCLHVFAAQIPDPAGRLMTTEESRFPLDSSRRRNGLRRRIPPILGVAPPNPPALCLHVFAAQIPDPAGRLMTTDLPPRPLRPGQGRPPHRSQPRDARAPHMGARLAAHWRIAFAPYRNGLIADRDLILVPCTFKSIFRVG
jgi:hypothetical protein